MVLAVIDDRVLVAPVTLDVEAADEETVWSTTPLGLAAASPAGDGGPPDRSWSTRDRGRAPAGGESDAAPAIVDATDPRLEVRQHLADRLGSFDGPPPDPSPADAPTRPDRSGRR